ncbi:Xylanase inhibitor, C-terminal [Dillenia turbinata]|uniref:Xylanase inhibitor, C-terminal n=1 Tax=Dillenia turbinata TaxID=194707 RepID=A0AAN8Z3L8_9MAGN
MAVTKNLLLVRIFSLLFTAVLSLSSPYSFDTLDVPSSIQKTLDVLSFTTHQSEAATSSSSSSSSSPSLPLHPRDSLFQPQHKDYRSLTLSRLARDSARVDSLNLRLQLALDNVNNSGQTVVQPEVLSSPVVPGTGEGSGQYYTRVGIGSPVKKFYMVIDTGSDVNWLQCKPCSSCYPQSDPIFNPSKSTSYSPLSCNTSTCRSLDSHGCRKGTCQFKVSYADESRAVGEFATETVSFGRSGKVNNVAIGCGRDNKGLFFGAAGLFGLGRGSLSLPAQIKATSFSYCLVNHDSRSWSTLDFNSSMGANSVRGPLIKNKNPILDTLYYVGMSGMSVGGKPVSIPTSVFQIDDSGRGGIIVDTGTTISRLPASAYKSLRDAFAKHTKDLPSATGPSPLDTCYNLTSFKSVKFPTVSFDFSNGKSVSLPLTNYLLPVDSEGTFCFAFAPMKGILSIIGDVQMQGARLSFDLKNSVIGFERNSC